MTTQDRDQTNVIITGVGGQGNVLAARLLGASALKEGYEAVVGDVYGLSQRGGSVSSHVRWTMGRTLPPLVPSLCLDVLIALEPLEALRILAQYGNEDTVAIVNDVPIMPVGVQQRRFQYPDLSELQDALKRLTKDLRTVGATEIAKDLGNVQVLNMVMMGALFGSGFMELDAGTFEQTAATLIPERFRDINLTAYRQGMDAVG